MTTFNNIRAALESEIANVTNIPSASNRAWENVSFSPNTGTTWVRMTLIPGEQRPAHLGTNPQIRYQGLFRIDIFVPEGDGAASADALADNIRDHFNVTDDFSSGGDTVRIRYSERGQGRSDPPWYTVPVTVSWYIFT